MSRSHFVNYFVAAASVGLIAAIKPPIERLAGPGPPLLFFVPAVTLTAWVGGLGPGLLAMVLSSAICCYYYFPPDGSFWVENSNDRFRLLLFWMQGVLTSVLMELLRASRRSAERCRHSLERSEGLNRALMDNAPAFLYIKDAEGRYLMTNRYYKGRFDNEGKPLVGLTDLDLHPRDLAEKYRADDRTVLTSGRPLQCEDIGRLADGPHTYLTVKFPLRDASGACYAVGGFSTDITERKRSEEALKESEGRLRCVTENARVGLVVVDEGYHYIYANRAYVEILGLSQEDIVGLEVADVLAPVYESQIRPQLDRAFRGERVTYELTIPQPGANPGAKRSFTVACEPQKDCLGASQVVVVIVDVTEQRRAEESIKENEGRLELFIEHAPVAIAMFDREMKYIAASRRWRSDYKLGKQELIGRSHYDICPDIPERWKVVHSQALSGEVVLADEDRFDRADGTMLWLRWEVRPWLNASGELGGIVIATEDITERKHAEEVNARLAAIVDSSDDSIVGEDLDGLVVSWNAGAERIFGYTADEAIGRPIDAVLNRPDRPGEAAALLANAERGEPLHNFETRRLRKDGSLVDVSVTISPIRDRAGKRIGISRIHRDITERKRSEEARGESERMALSVLDSISSHIAVLDESGTILRVNRSWRLFAETNGVVGQVNEGANYLDVCDSVAGEDREMATAFATGIREVLVGRRDLSELEYPCHSPSQRRWFIGRVTPFPNGGPRRVVVSHQNVTALKLAEEQLRESEWVLRQSQRMACVGNWELDLGDLSMIRAGALRWSDECFRIFGYEPGQVAVTNDLFFHLVHPDDREAVSAALARALRENGAYRIEHRIVRPDGIERVVFEWGETLIDPSGHPIRLLGTCQDITERKQTEIALQRYANRLEHLRKIDRAILSSFSPWEVAEAALEHLARLVPYWSAGVTVFDLDKDEVEVIAAKGFLREWYPPGTRNHGELKAHPEIYARLHGLGSTEEVPRADWKSPFLKGLQAAGMQSYVLIPLQDGGPPVGSLLLVSDSPAAFSADRFEVIREVADQLAIVIRQTLLLEDLDSARKRADALTRQLIRAEEGERRRIARELHDEIGQALTALKINLQETIRGSNDRASRLEDSIAIVDVTLEQVRGMALDLRPSILDDLGLVAALNWYVERHAKRTGLQGRFIADPDDIHADPEIETACFRVAQEALTNVARHARATRFSVELLQYSGGLQLVVRDNGIGFEPGAALRAAFRGASLGLVGMRERVELVGGRIAFVSEPTGGTEVQVDFPNEPILPHSAIERDYPGGPM